MEPKKDIIAIVGTTGVGKSQVCNTVLDTIHWNIIIANKIVQYRIG